MDELHQLAAELSRLEESAKHSAQVQFEQAKLWRGVNLALGVPAAACAAIAGASGLANEANRTWAAILALVSAGLGAMVTSLNASSRSERAQAAGNAYLAIQTEARQSRLLDLPTVAAVEARQQVAALTKRVTEINAEAEAPARLAYLLGRRNISSGGQTYEVDK